MISKTITRQHTVCGSSILKWITIVHENTICINVENHKKFKKSLAGSVYPPRIHTFSLWVDTFEHLIFVVEIFGGSSLCFGLHWGVIQRNYCCIP